MRAILVAILMLLASYNVTSRSDAAILVIAGNTGGCAPAPPLATANGYYNCVFGENFANLSDMDLSNTNAPGFTWYASHPNYQGAVISNVTSADFTALNPGVELTSAPTNGGGFGLMTDGYLTMAGPNLIPGNIQMQQPYWGTLNVFDPTFSTTILAPDGVTQAQKLTENTTTGGHNVFSGTFKATGSGATYTYSTYCIPAEEVNVQLTLNDQNASNGVFAVYNCSTGTISTAATTFGTGWTSATASTQICSTTYAGCSSGYRLSLKVSVPSATAGITSTKGLVNSSLANSYAGTNGHGEYFWCDQLEIASSASACQITSVTRDIGTLFDGSKGGYIEIYAATDLSVNLTKTVWIEQEIGLFQSMDVPKPAYTEACEFDFFENLTSASTTSNSHQWNGPYNSSPSTNWATLTQSNGVADSGYHKYGFLWIPTTKGGGTGTVTRYLDGVQYAILTYGASASPTATPGTWAGAMGASMFVCEKSMATEPLMGFNLIMATGVNTFMKLGYIRWWQ